jgi:hypothetical protein
MTSLVIHFRHPNVQINRCDRTNEEWLMASNPKHNNPKTTCARHLTFFIEKGFFYAYERAPKMNNGSSEEDTPSSTRHPFLLIIYLTCLKLA